MDWLTTVPRALTGVINSALPEQFLIAEKGGMRVYLTVEREEGADKAEISAEFPVQ